MMNSDGSIMTTQMGTIALPRSRFGVDTGRAREEKLERIEQKGDIMIIIMTISACQPRPQFIPLVRCDWSVKADSTFWYSGLARSGPNSPECTADSVEIGRRQPEPADNLGPGLPDLNYLEV